MTYIYKITNTLNDCAYFGYSSVNQDVCWKRQKKAIEHGSYQWSKIARDESNSPDDFIFEVIEEVGSVDEARVRIDTIVEEWSVEHETYNEYQLKVLEQRILRDEKIKNKQ